MRRNTLSDIDDDDDDKTWATGTYKITQGLFAVPVDTVLVIFLRPMKLKTGKFVK